MALTTPRRRTISGAYNNPPHGTPIAMSRIVDRQDSDYEKVDHYDEKSSMFDIDSESSSPSRASGQDYSPMEPILPHSPAASRRRRPIWRLPRNPHTFIRYLCFAIMGLIVLMILYLVSASMNSAQHLLRQPKPPPPPPVWESFPFLRRYFGGIRTLVPKNESVPEFPRDQSTPLNYEVTQTLQPVPSSTPYIPYPDYLSSSYQNEFGVFKECFLDERDSISVPHVHVYDGVPQGMPDPIIGSFELTGLSDSVCFDRYGKYGPYGYGYSRKKGGIGLGLEGEREGAENVWGGRLEVNYTGINWGDAQDRCLQKNKDRFVQRDGSEKDLFREMPVGMVTSNGEENVKESAQDKRAIKKMSRSAVVIRSWHDYAWHADDILFVRSLVAELSLLSGGEFTIHFLIHVRDENSQIWSDPETYNRVVRESVPEEFWGMVTLWSEKQMAMIYSGLEETNYRNLWAYGVYRSAPFPLQYFAHMHPEYDYFWNWEMDIRYTGHWYHFFDTLRSWARAQPRKGMWERSHRFYIPSVHGTWERFKTLVEFQSETPTSERPSKFANLDENGKPQEPKHEKLIWGAEAGGNIPQFASDPVPPTSRDADNYEWGVGEEADLMTFNPMFDPDRTGWNLEGDVTGYDVPKNGYPPRRAAIVTASRMSRRLLLTMHAETALHRHSMFSEMWPASCALHHGLKAVYVPHPVFIDRDWHTKYFAEQMNHGPNGASGGGRLAVFNDGHQHNFLGTTWYYHAGFPRNLWRRWLGLRVDGNGGEMEEMAGEGRMCLPGMLLHPVKDMDVPGEETRIDAAD